MKRLIAIALLASASAHAEFKDGNMLLADMNSTPINQMNALGYVTGVADALMRITYCPPSNINAGQVYDMAKQYLEAYPTLRSFAADSLINRVLSNAWPCAKKGQNL